MGSRTKSRQDNFRARTGSSSTRAKSTGETEFCIPELQPTLANQLQAFIDGNGTEDEFKRYGGSLRAVLHNEQRRRYEAIFVAVACGRLPKDVFLSIVEEARTIWRGEYTTIVPPDFQHLKKLRKLRGKGDTDA